MALTDRDKREVAAAFDRRRRVLGDERSVAQRAGDVVTPAERISVEVEGAGVREPSRELLELEGRRDRLRNGTVGVGAVAKLALFVVAPAVRGAVGGQTAIV